MTDTRREDDELWRLVIEAQAVADAAKARYAAAIATELPGELSLVDLRLMQLDAEANVRRAYDQWQKQTSRR